MSDDLPDMKDKIHLVNQSEQGRDLIAAGDVERGLALLRGVVASEPDDVLFLREFGVALSGLAQYEEAADMWRRVAEHRPDDAASLNRLGVAYYHLGKFPEAQAAYESSVAADALFPDPHSNLLILFLDQDQPDRALTHGISALEISPDLAEVHHNVALVHERMGNLSEAHRHWAEALRIEPVEQRYFLMMQRMEQVLADEEARSKTPDSPEG